MAYNQGFYNLFLAVGAVTGLVLYGAGRETAGTTAAVFACACMAGRMTHLFRATANVRVRSAFTQGRVHLPDQNLRTVTGRGDLLSAGGGEPDGIAFRERTGTF